MGGTLVRIWGLAAAVARSKNRTKESFWGVVLKTAPAGGTRPGTFSMKYKVLGIPVCRQAFITLTGIHACTLQRARQQVSQTPNISPHSLGCWVGRRPLAYMDARSWILQYSKTHGDTSPMNTKIFLPCGKKQYYWSVYFKDRSDKGTPANQVAGLTTFLLAWRVELPFIEVRSSTGPFTHCGLCDYLRCVVASAGDADAKRHAVLRLGEHYDFQAAQRIAMNAMIAASERDPTELFVVSWDKMDQAKTIVPRVKALANTLFFKSGHRLVVSMIGCLAPCAWQRPLFYTVFEDQTHGGNMIASLLVDVLLEATSTIGTLPRRVFVQANNTGKETKNTVVLWAAVWLLVHLKGTRLEAIEFGYLMVGHTHDLVDAVFAYLNKVKGPERRRRNQVVVTVIVVVLVVVLVVVSVLVVLLTIVVVVEQ